MTYWISSGDPYGHFYMDSRTADILLVKPLDYENQTQFNLTVSTALELYIAIQTFGFLKRNHLYTQYMGILKTMIDRKKLSITEMI